jgi:hypothetical protein
MKFCSHCGATADTIRAPVELTATSMPLAPCPLANPNRHRRGFDPIPSTTNGMSPFSSVSLEVVANLRHCSMKVQWHGRKGTHP